MNNTTHYPETTTVAAPNDWWITLLVVLFGVGAALFVIAFVCLKRKCSEKLRSLCGHETNYYEPAAQQDIELTESNEPAICTSERPTKEERTTEEHTTEEPTAEEPIIAVQLAVVSKENTPRTQIDIRSINVMIREKITELKQRPGQQPEYSTSGDNNTSPSAAEDCQASSSTTEPQHTATFET